MDAKRDAGDVDQVSWWMSLQAGLALSGMSLEQLWIRAVCVGGALTRDQLGEALEGKFALTRYDHDVIAQALNDYFTERGLDHPVAYADELAPGTNEPR